MGHKPFSELTKNWSPERKAEVEAAGKKLIAELEGFSAIRETAVGMYKAGVIDRQTMREFDELLAKKLGYEPEEVFNYVLDKGVNNYGDV